MRVCLCFLGCDTEKEIWRDKNEWNDFVCETNDELTKISHTPEKTLVDEAKGEMEKGGGKRQVPCRAVPCHTMPCRGILSRIKHSKLSVKTFYLSKTNIYIQNALTENKFFSLVWFGHCSTNRHTQSECAHNILLRSACSSRVDGLMLTKVFNIIQIERTKRK